MWKFIVDGGWLMLPIFICSFFSVMIIVERLFFYFFSVSKFKSTLILSEVLECVRKNKITEAIDICKTKSFYLTNILKAGLFYCDGSREIVRETMENASLCEIPKLEKNLNFLSTLAHISPLIGLLGTVVGLVKCFQNIEEVTAVAGMVNPSTLAGGIRVALHTTVGGLCVAIPAYIAYNYFVHKVNLYVREAEIAAVELIEVFSQSSTPKIK